jgi:hypothetical protein
MSSHAKFLMTISNGQLHTGIKKRYKYKLFHCLETLCVMRLHGGDDILIDSEHLVQ